MNGLQLMPTRADVALLAVMLDPQAQVRMKPKAVIVYTEHLEPFLNLPYFKVQRLGQHAVKLELPEVQVSIVKTMPALRHGNFFYPF